MTEKTCVKCQRTSNEIPLIQFEFKGGQHCICPNCLPVLIHKPHELAANLPGIENVAPASHQH